MLGVSDPGQFVTANIHQVAAYVCGQLGFVGSVHDGRAAHVQHAQRTVGLFYFLIDPGSGFLRRNNLGQIADDNGDTLRAGVR
jgi:hypothetical protein